MAEKPEYHNAPRLKPGDIEFGPSTLRGAYRLWVKARSDAEYIRAMLALARSVEPEHSDSE